MGRSVTHDSNVETGRARHAAGCAGNSGRPTDAIRAELAGRLRARCHEIEKTVLARVRRLADPVDGLDSVNSTGLGCAVAGAVCYGIEGIEKGAEWPVLIPPSTARQARRAAQEGVGLDVLLRRYAAGNKALEEFIVAEADGVPSGVLCEILSDQAPRIDRLLESVAGEYKEEYEQTRRLPSRRKADRIIRLLQSDGPASPSDLDYDFDDWHVGLILKGPGAELAAQTCAERLGYRLLQAPRDSETTWGWLSSRSQPVAGKLEAFLAEAMPVQISMAIGEPRPGLEGWRFSHREAQMALRVMLRSGQRLVRGRDVILHVAVMKDDTFARSLVDAYLVPLKRHANARKLLEALRAYLATGGNAAAAGASIGVARHTVQRRIRTVEETLGRPFHSCFAELHIALQIEELEAARRA
jgi:hypothetical protein